MWTRVQWGAGKRAGYGNLLCAWCFLPSSPSVLQGQVSLTCDQLPERGGSGCCCLHSSCSLPGRLRTGRPEVAQLDGQQGGEDPLSRLSPTPDFLLRLLGCCWVIRKWGEVAGPAQSRSRAWEDGMEIWTGLLHLGSCTLIPQADSLCSTLFRRGDPQVVSSLSDGGRCSRQTAEQVT